MCVYIYIYIYIYIITINTQMAALWPECCSTMQIPSRTSRQNHASHEHSAHGENK